MSKYLSDANLYDLKTVTNGFVFFYIDRQCFNYFCCLILVCFIGV